MSTREHADLLTGYEAIGEYLNWKPRTVRHRVVQGEIPTFKVGRHCCARRSSLNAWLAEQEASSERRALLAQRDHLLTGEAK